jgi:hypothetical protein
MRAQTVSDPDGDTLSFGWSYGDGASGNGGTTDHQYQSASTYTVTLTTKDSKNNQATSTAPALVKSMTGRWSGYVSGWGSFTVNLTQSGTNITGTYSDSYGPGTISSYVYAPRNTYMKVTQVLGSSTYTLTFNCSVDATVDRCGSILTRN